MKDEIIGQLYIQIRQKIKQSITTKNKFIDYK